jgi:hypothetical protein
MLTGIVSKQDRKQAEDKLNDNDSRHGKLFHMDLAVGSGARHQK